MTTSPQMTPSATHQFSVDSPLTAAETFARLADLRRVNEWDEGVTNPRQIYGVGPGQGARFEVTVVGFDGLPTQVVYELVEYDAPQRFVMIGRHPSFEAHDTVVVSESEGPNTRSRVDYTAKLTLLGDNPPLNGDQLNSVFAKIAGVAERGITDFLAS